MPMFYDNEKHYINNIFDNFDKDNVMKLIKKYIQCINLIIIIFNITHNFIINLFCKFIILFIMNFCIEILVFNLPKI